jgi:uncharacterized membrane protein
MRTNRALILAAGIIIVVPIVLWVRYAIHERAHRLEEQRQETARWKQQEAEAEKKARAEEQEREAEADKKRQAEKREEEAREALGDRIDAQVGYLGLIDPPSLALFNSNPSLFIKNYHMDQYNGYRIQNLSMFINRNNGTLTISFGCQFTGGLTSLSRMMVRLFDRNGEFLTYFVTKEYFAAPGCLYHSSDPSSCNGAIPLKPESNLLQYTVNLRDAAFVRQAEFGLYTR